MDLSKFQEVTGHRAFPLSFAPLYLWNELELTVLIRRTDSGHSRTRRCFHPKLRAFRLVELLPFYIFVRGYHCSRFGLNGESGRSGGGTSRSRSRNTHERGVADTNWNPIQRCGLVRHWKSRESCMPDLSRSDADQRGVFDI